MIPNLVRLAQRKQTYTNMGYLLLSFPLGVVYVVVLLVGLTSGIATLIVWVGVPILLFTLFAWWKVAAFERYLAIKWLHVEILPMALPSDKKAPRWERLRRHLSNSVTWKSLLYLFLKPLFSLLALAVTLDVVALVVALSAVALGIGLVVSPFFFLFTVIMIPSMKIAPVSSMQSLPSKAPVRAMTLGRVLLISITAGGITFAPLYAINGMAWAWGQMARLMLGMSDKDIRLAEARALAEQERARAELAEQKRSELIVNVSHELRTPVASIRGHLEALLKAYEGDEGGSAPTEASLRKYLTIVHRESVRLGSLVDDLLSLAKTEANELRLNISAVEAGEVVEEVYQTLMPLAKRERQITLVRSISNGLPPVMADRQRLMQVILNLVRNAITYTPDGGIVSIALARHNGDALVLSVSDTGIGIPPEDLQRVFERFYRTDASRTRTSGGFGLGLSIVRDLVTAMGGSVTVESKVNEGSCFHVFLCTVK